VSNHEYSKLRSLLGNEQNTNAHRQPEQNNIRH